MPLDPVLLRACPREIPDAIAFLRQEGCSAIATMAALVEHWGLSVSEAKQTVHFSEAWRDARSDHEALHDQIIAALEITDADPDAA